MSESESDQQPSQPSIPMMRKRRSPCLQCGALNTEERKFCFTCGYVFGSKVTQTIGISSKNTTYAHEVSFTVTEINAKFEFIHINPLNVELRQTIAEITMDRSAVEELVKMMKDTLKQEVLFEIICFDTAQYLSATETSSACKLALPYSFC